MGLAASQARYLDLTARKSNVEFQGQMVNQQRTELANESAGIFAEMLTLEAPVPPSASDYQTSAYNFSGIGSNSTSKYILTNWTSATGNTGTGNYDVEIKYNTGNGTAANPEYAYIYGNANLTVDGTTNRITSIFMNSFTGGDTHIQADIGIGSSNAHTTSYTKESDEIRYQEAMNKYNYDYSLYQKRMNELQTRTQKIQVQDRTLELQLRQLDTEQEALQTEMESVKKVIESSVDQIFKTFQS